MKWNSRILTGFSRGGLFDELLSLQVWTQSKHRQYKISWKEGSANNLIDATREHLSPPGIINEPNKLNLVRSLSAKLLPQRYTLLLNSSSCSSVWIISIYKTLLIVFRYTTIKRTFPHPRSCVLRKISPRRTIEGVTDEEGGSRTQKVMKNNAPAMIAFVVAACRVGKPRKSVCYFALILSVERIASVAVQPLDAFFQRDLLACL